MLSETQIYIQMKKWLKCNDWIVLGGQPPGGTNDIPLLELKDLLLSKMGSKGSKKVDLVAYKQGYFLLLELKRTFSKTDIAKLNEITTEKKWRIAFIRMLKERRIFEMLSIPAETEQAYLDTSKYYIKAVGFNYTGKAGPEDFVTFLVSSSGITVKIGSKVNQETVRLLSPL